MSNTIGLMKRLFIFPLLIVLLLITPSVTAQSRDSQEVEVTNVKSNETINRNYFAANERIEIEGTVNGDAFVAGGLVNISGKINGDLLVAGGEVNISGEVTDDVRVAGGQVRISGKVGKNLTVAGGNVDVSEAASIANSVVAFGGNITLAGKIGGTVNGGVGNLTIDNSVQGDVEVGVGMLRLNSNAVIDGNLTYWSDTEATVSSSATVSGDIIKRTPPMTEKDSVDTAKFLGVVAVFSLIIKLINIISWFVVGLLLINWAPKFLESTVANLKQKAWPSLGVGFLAAVTVLVVAIFLIVILVGLPLGIMLLAVYWIMLYLAKLPVIYFIGVWTLKKFGSKTHQVWSLVIGLLIYGVLTLVPVLGFFIGIFATLFGLGAWILTKQQLYSELRKKNLI